MKTGIIYYSKHHGNTKKLLDAIQKADQTVTLIDVTEVSDADLSGYDRIGLASGIYYNEFAKQVISFAEAHLPENKEVFFIYTHGAPAGRFLNGIRQVTRKNTAGSWVNLAVLDLIPLVRSNWLAELPKAIRTKKKSMRQWIFIGCCKNSL